MLPLAGIAFYSMHLRVIQYGWTPERIWGVIAAIIALAYGVAGLWSVVKGRRDFDGWLRPLQQKLAIGLALLALFLALPILDFGAISTRDQLARLKSGATPVEKFDWAAMAYDFGPSGRAALKELARSPQKSAGGCGQSGAGGEKSLGFDRTRGSDLAQALRRAAADRSGGPRAAGRSARSHFGELSVQPCEGMRRGVD